MPISAIKTAAIQLFLALALFSNASSAVASCVLHLENRALADQDFLSEGLVDRLRKNDNEAWTRFTERYTGPLERYLYRKGYGNNEDAIQTAFMQLVEMREELRPGVQLRGLLFRIAYLRRLDEFRKLDSKQNVPLDADLLDSMATLDLRGNAISRFWGNRSNSQFFELLAADAIRAAFERLSPNHQEALTLSTFSDQPLAVIAAQMGVTKNRVSVLTSEAKAKMREHIGKVFGPGNDLSRETLTSLFPNHFNESDPDAPPNPEGKFLESPLRSQR
jgi:RNA polymerase sigma factor (sigma-70 family)